MEFDRTPSQIREGLMTDPFDQEDGFLAVPEGPGLGVEVDEAKVVELASDRSRKFRWPDARLRDGSVADY